MTLPKFPFIPEQASYNYTKAKELVAISLEGGLSKSRRDIVGGAATVDCTWFLDLAEYQYFSAFFNVAISHGADEFRIDLLLDQPELSEYTAKFVVDSFELSEPSGLQVVVTAQLEVIPIDTKDLDEIVLALYGVDGYFAELTTLVNESLVI